MSRPEDLAKEHWDYLVEVLKVHEAPEAVLRVIELHYKTAFVHGYKHAVEDAVNLQNKLV